jgi:hypothetical protein
MADSLADLSLATGATGLEQTQGERIALRYRAPNPYPQPLIAKAHPARHRQPHRNKRYGAHQRATIVAGGNPATVQLDGQDVAYTVALAQHVDPTTIAVGGSVIVAMMDESDPTDALIVAAY